MNPKFEVLFLEEAIEFVSELEKKSRYKVYYNIDRAKYINDPKLFKKIEDEIWYFRVAFSSMQYRIFAFWDKTGDTNTLVVATHGVIKKSNKVPKYEIAKAERIRREYFLNKMLKK